MAITKIIQLTVGIAGLVLLFIIQFRLLILWQRHQSTRHSLMDSKRLKTEYPDKTTAIWIYQIASFAVPLLSFVATAGCMYLLSLRKGYIPLNAIEGFFLMSCFLGLPEILRGVYSLVFRLDIVYGFVHRARQQKYALHPHIHQLAYLRILLVLLVLAIQAGLTLFFSR